MLIFFEYGRADYVWIGVELGFALIAVISSFCD